MSAEYWTAAPAAGSTWQEAPAQPQSSLAAPAAPGSAAAPAPRSAEPIRIEPYLLPTAALRSLAEQVGLEWVHSDEDKVRAAQEAIAATPPPARVPRPPRPAVVPDDGPLVLVETRKDLAQLKLPFEQDGRAG
jgi:ribonuclease E